MVYSQYGLIISEIKNYNMETGLCDIKVKEKDSKMEPKWINNYSICNISADRGIAEIYEMAGVNT